MSVWPIMPLGQLIEEVSERNRDMSCTDVYSVTNSQGFVPSEDYFNKKVFSKDITNYKLVRRGMFAYNPSRINVGSISWLQTKDCVAVSPLYVIFRVNGEKLLQRWVEYFLRSDIGLTQIRSLTSGSVRDTLKYSALERIEIPVAPIEKQREMVETMEAVDEAIEVCQAILDKTEELVKSRFVEMFGQIGADDKGWGITTLGQCCELNPKKAKIPDQLEVSFVPMSAVSEHGYIDTSDIRLYADVKKGFTYFEEFDVLFAKITPCMENGKGAIALGLANGIGVGSTEFHVLRPLKGKSNPYWLYILTRMEGFRSNAQKVMTGTGGQLRVPITFLRDFPISLPPIDLQCQFEQFFKLTDKSKLVIRELLEKHQLMKEALMQKYFG